MYFSEMHIFQSRGIKSCGSCSSYLVSGAQILSLIYPLAVRLLPLLPSCPNIFCIELAVVLRSCLAWSSFPLSKDSAPGYFCIIFFVECLLAMFWAKGTSLLSILKLQRFPGCSSPERRRGTPEPFYAYCQAALVGRVCRLVPCASPGVCLPWKQHGGVLLQRELGFEACGACLRGVYFWY